MIALKGLTIRLIKSISNEIENIIKEEDSMKEYKQKLENHSLQSSSLEAQRETTKTDNPIWYDKEYNEDNKGNMRWEFEIWNFGYSDAFDYCKDIWLAFGYNIIVGEHIDYVETLVWFFSIDDLPCMWCFNDYPPYQYVTLCTRETEENLKRLEEYVKVIVDELNKCVKNNEIEPLM